MKKPLFSVIICTYNRASFLDDCIYSVLNQDLDRDQFELIIVDNASTDDTQQVVRERQYSSEIVLLQEPVPGLSRARNTGWRHAHGDIIAYLDDDARADKDWLRNAAEGFSDFSPAPDVLAGPIRLFGEEIPSWVTDDLKCPLGYLQWGDLPLQVRYNQKKIVGANCFFTKAILEQTMGFDENLGRKKKLLLSGEEVMLQKRIEELGGAIWYHPGASVEHFVPHERVQPLWYYRRYYWGGVSDYVMSKMNKVESNRSSEYPVHGAAIKYEGKVAQLRRFITHTLCSLGLGGSREKTIRARIYMSYVLGYTQSALGLRR